MVNSNYNTNNLRISGGGPSGQVSPVGAGGCIPGSAGSLPDSDSCPLPQPTTGDCGTSGTYNLDDWVTSCWGEGKVQSVLTPPNGDWWPQPTDGDCAKGWSWPGLGERIVSTGTIHLVIEWVGVGTPPDFVNVDIYSQAIAAALPYDVGGPLYSDNGLGSVPQITVDGAGRPLLSISEGTRKSIALPVEGGQATYPVAVNASVFATFADPIQFICYATVVNP